MNNQLQLRIGADTFDLAFNMAAYKAIKKFTGEDPLKLAMDLSELEGIEKYGIAFFHAGLLGKCAELEQQPGFTTEQVAIWSDKLSIVDLTQIFQAYKKSMTVEADGEVSRDTQ